jgi:hypothetical protein
MKSAKVGDRVSYEDMANPRRVGTVVEEVRGPEETPSGLPLPEMVQYRVVWDHERGSDEPSEETTSDLRQAGWKRVEVKQAAAIAKRVQSHAKYGSRGRIRQQFLTAEIVKSLPPIYSQDGQGFDAVAKVKFFGAGRWTFYATEASAVINGEEVAFCDADPNGIEDVHFFGFLVSPLGADCDELCYLSLSELVTLRFQFGLAVERDYHFDPQTLRAILREGN